MPGMNGLEFVKRIKQDPRLAGIPCVLLTSDEEVETELRGLKLGADEFVRKSEDPRVLAMHVRRLIEQTMTAHHGARRMES